MEKLKKGKVEILMRTIGTCWEVICGDEEHRETKLFKSIKYRTENSAVV